MLPSAFNTVLFGQAPPKPYQNHHLDSISLLMDGSGSGLLNPDTDRRKNPDPSGSETLLSSEFLSSNIYPILTCVDPNPQSS